MRAVSSGMRFYSKRSALNSFLGIYGDIGGSIIAIPGIAEKGYVDTRVKVSTPGGHSSVPPPHTVSSIVFLTNFI